MNYLSTRGAARAVSFREAVMTGLAPDGGLFLPERLPDARAQLSAWAKLSYRELAFEILRLFTDLPEAELKDLIARSYASFRHPEVTPVVEHNGRFILELFHGPTLAFKDVALQLLGNLFEHFLAASGRELNILAATSGDTGSAAIYSVRGRRRIRIFVLFPRGRISPAQERQMTSVTDANVFNIAVEGSFDDCQNIVKTIFGDLSFKARYALGAVNSINWARIVAQVVYYFYAAFRVMECTGRGRVRFTVPTGNFGDIFAGYIACRMGLPVGQLVLATNENDILARFFNTGVYRRGALRATASPAMDIQVASNFERYLYYHVGEKPAVVCALMQQFAETGELTLARGPAGRIDELISAEACDTRRALETIREFHAQSGYLLDPHTAVGLAVARAFPDADAPMICLATAHPAKFGDAIRQATGRDLARHAILESLRDLPVRCAVLPAAVPDVRAFIAAKCV